MAALVFWFIIVPIAAIVLLGILIKVVIPWLFFKATGTAKAALDRKFERDYLTNPVSDRKVQRKMSLTFWSRWAMLAFGVLMVAFPIVKLVSEGEIPLEDFLPYVVVGALGVGIFILGIVSMHRTKQLAALIAEPVIREVFGADSQYGAFGHIPDECIAEAGFVKEYDRVYGDDFVRGHYRGIPVMFSDVRLVRVDLQYNSETKKTVEHENELFKGHWLVADFDRELAARPLTVMERHSWSNPIQMESEAFNRKFSVFCADEHTAFYILTPHFMERLIAVDDAADGKSYFHFAKKRLQVAVETRRDLFEAKMFKAPDVNAMRERFRGELGRLTAVLDEMLNHERLFGSGKD
ncbi:MAG: DUF3137 domain-containing protein [Clostridiales bacterium]|jgi:hypothetical protein|nr:DUF3137 domain-containing protein [Clostridiales bacterium]